MTKVKLQGTVKFEGKYYGAGEELEVTKRLADELIKAGAARDPKVDEAKVSEGEQKADQLLADARKSADAIVEKAEQQLKSSREDADKIVKDAQEAAKKLEDDAKAKADKIVKDAQEAADKAKAPKSGAASK